MARRSLRERVLTIAALVALVALTTMSVPSSAWAQASGIDYSAAFRQGLEEYEAGRTSAAIQIWERMLATLGEERGYKVCYNLGLAYQKLGDATRAVERLQSFATRAEKEAGKDPSLDERQKDAIDRIKAIKASHGALHVAPSPDGQVVLVRIGSSEPRPAGFVVYLAPGEHEIELHAGTARARRVRHTVVAGATKDVTPEPSVTTTPTSQAVEPQPKAAPGTASFPTAWLIGGLAVTAASSVLPLAFGLDAKSKRDDADALGPGHTGYAAAANDFDDARSRYQISWVLPGALAAATAAIVIIQIVTDKRPSSSAGIGGQGFCVAF
jgi:tetratricopeptide (TPR) repeat protein